MALNKQMRLLQHKWKSQKGWPRRVKWLEINGLRGWTGQRADLVFPIMAICGENPPTASLGLDGQCGMVRRRQVGRVPLSSSNNESPDRLPATRGTRCQT
jgi:hypothetical protein